MYLKNIQNFVFVQLTTMAAAMTTTTTHMNVIQFLIFCRCNYSEHEYHKQVYIAMSKFDT